MSQYVKKGRRARIYADRDRRILEMRRAGMTLVAISKELGRSPALIRYISYKELWREKGAWPETWNASEKEVEAIAKEFEMLGSRKKP